MSSRTKGGRSSHRRSSYSSSWSDWEWSEEYQCETRQRSDSKGELKYEYRQSSFTPRNGATDPPALNIIAQSSQQDYTSGNYAYQGNSSEDVTYSLANTNLTSPPYTSSTSTKGKGVSTDYSTNGNASSNYRTIKTQNTVAPLDKNFFIHGSNEFTLGRVIKLLWSEPCGSGGTEVTGYGRQGSKYGESAYSSIRRFVIVSTRSGHSLCLPILTYGGRATTKPGVHSEDHTVIYSSKEKGPVMLSGERLTKKAIRVKPLNEREKLDHASRLNYAKVYTVEHNVKVSFVGEVVRDHQQILLAEYHRTHQPLTDPTWSSESPKNVVEQSQGEEPAPYQNQQSRVLYPASPSYSQPASSSNQYSYPATRPVSYSLPPTIYSDQASTHGNQEGDYTQQGDYTQGESSRRSNEDDT